MSSFQEWRPDLTLRPSRSAAAWVSVFHVVSLLAVLCTVIYDTKNLSLLLFVFPVVSISLLRGILLLGFASEKPNSSCFLVSRVQQYMRKRVVIAIKKSESELWQVFFADGTHKTCILKQSSVISRYFMCLYFSAESERFSLPASVLIISDGVGWEDYRKFQVWLRWQSNKVLGMG